MGPRVHLVNPSHVVVRRGGHHAAVALRPGCGHRHELGRSDHRRRDARAPRSRPVSATATWSASAFIPAMRCAATKSAGWRASAAPGSSTAAFTPRSSRRKRTTHGAAHAVVKGDGDLVWPQVVRGLPRRRAAAGSTTADALAATSSCRRAGTCCPKAATCGPRCRPCAAARSTARSARCGAPTDRSRGSATVDRRRRRDRRAAAARLPLHRARRRQLLSGHARRPRDGAPARTTRRGCTSWRRCAQERFELMAQLAQLPDDMVFFTQITMEAAEDPAFLDAMRKARIRGALVGVESVTAGRAEGRLQGLQPVGRRARRRGCGRSGEHGVHVLGSFIFGLPSDRADTFDATVALAKRADLDLRAVRPADAVSRHARFREVGGESRTAAESQVDGIPVTQHWLIPQRAPAEAVHAASDDGAGGDPRAHAGRLGPVLQLAGRLGALARRQIAQGTRRCSC